LLLPRAWAENGDGSAELRPIARSRRFVSGRKVLKMKIGVVHDYADVFRRARAFARLEGHEVLIDTGVETEPSRLADLLAGCDAVVLTQQRVRFPRAVIEQLPRLKFISQTGRNAYHIDLQACTEHGVAVSVGGTAGRTGGEGNFSATVELAWALILSALHHVPYEVERLKQGHWQSTVGTSVFGKTLGIYAYGHIGKPVAQVGRALGMKVVCWGRERSTAAARADGFVVAPRREAFFESVDVLSLHLASNDQTRGIVTAEDLGRMKPTALLVNTSRARIIAEGALVAALERGRPGFAAVDVFEDEPVVGAGHPLLAMSNALCTPHLGYNDRETFERFYDQAVDQLLAFAAGTPVNVVNPEALDVARRRG
jgi:D-3-phosphoglycerate dehydrogenase